MFEIPSLANRCSVLVSTPLRVVTALNICGFASAAGLLGERRTGFFRGGLMSKVFSLSDPRIFLDTAVTQSRRFAVVVPV